MTVKATQIDHEKMMYNITCVYRDADETQHAEGLLWYENAQKAAYHIALKYDVPVYLVVAVIAALSPNNKWSRNRKRRRIDRRIYPGRRDRFREGLDLSQDETKGLGHLGDAS